MDNINGIIKSILQVVAVVCFKVLSHLSLRVTEKKNVKPQS
jgi:hypothetical protein